MIRKKERVVLIKGDGTKWYEQAVFIVNSKFRKDAMPVDFIEEAEQIMREFNLNCDNEAILATTENHHMFVKTQVPKKDAERKRYLVPVVTALVCVAVAAVFVFGFLG